MRYTPGQVRQVVGISQETLRHWRSVLGSLDGTRGPAPSFRPSQLLGLAVVRWLVEEIGLNVGSLKGVERQIFDLCGGVPWVRLARGVLIVQPVGSSVQFVLTVSTESVGRGAVIVPLAPIVGAVREALLEVAPEEEQQSIPFPPVEVHEKVSDRAGGRQP